MAEKAKTKRVPSGPIDSTSFMSRWLFASIIVWPMFAIISLMIVALSWLFVMIISLGNIDPQLFPSAIRDSCVFLLSGIGIGFSIGTLQKSAIIRVLHAHPTRWVAYSVLGCVIAAGIFILFYITNQFGGNGTGALIFLASFAGLLFAIGSFFQWLQLRKLVHDAWLWVLAHAIGAIISTIPVVGLLNLADDILAGMAAVLICSPLVVVVFLGAVTGRTLLWLFNNRRIADTKFKLDDWLATRV